MAIALNPKYRSDIAVVRGNQTLTDVQLNTLHALGFKPNVKDDGCSDFVVLMNTEEYALDGDADYAIHVEEQYPAFEGQVQSDYVFDSVAELLTAITTPAKVGTGMPWAVLEPTITNEHIRVLKQLGYTEDTDFAFTGEKAFLITNDGSGEGLQSYVIGAPAFIITSYATLGYGTIYKSLDELIDDLVLLHTIS